MASKIRRAAFGGMAALALAFAMPSHGMAAVYDFTFTNFSTGAVDAAGTFTTGGAGADAGFFLLTNLDLTSFLDLSGTLDTGSLSATVFVQGSEYNPSSGAFENHYQGGIFPNAGQIFLQGNTGPNNFGPSANTAPPVFSQVGAVTLFELESASKAAVFPGTLNVSAVPEPSIWTMMLLGFGGIGFLAYRKAAKGGNGAAMIAA